MYSYTLEERTAKIADRIRNLKAIYARNVDKLKSPPSGAQEHISATEVAEISRDLIQLAARIEALVVINKRLEQQTLEEARKRITQRLIQQASNPKATSCAIVNFADVSLTASFAAELDEHGGDLGMD